MPEHADLTPFGFTPTESLVYSALLDRGPTSAYALARELGLARANAYQALNGLCLKGAGVQIESNPKIYRATDPDGVLAMITERELAKLDRLGVELSTWPGTAAPTTTPFSSERAFREIALRTAVRARSLTCIASLTVLVSLNPIWRKRAVDRSESRLWAIGEADGSAAEVSVSLAGYVGQGDAERLFGAEPALLVVEGAAILGRRVGERMEGYWTSDPLFVAAALGASERLTPT